MPDTPATLPPPPHPALDTTGLDLVGRERIAMASLSAYYAVVALGVACAPELKAELMTCIQGIQNALPHTSSTEFAIATCRAEAWIRARVIALSGAPGSMATDPLPPAALVLR